MDEIQFPFHCHEIVDGQEADDCGRSADLPSCVTIACAHYLAKQTNSMSNDYGVGVYDAENVLVALVGKAPV